MEWKLQDAKNQFSKLVQMARSEGPQAVTVPGERTAVVLSVIDYDRMRAGRPTFVDDLLGGQAWDDELVETITPRVKTTSRDVTF